MKLIILLLLAAQLNYNNVVNQVARLNDGTDIHIEQLMYERGFDVDAYNPSQPTMKAKIVALFTNNI